MILPDFTSQHPDNATTYALFRISGWWRHPASVGIHDLPASYYSVTQQVCAELHLGMFADHDRICTAAWLEATTSTYDEQRTSTFQFRYVRCSHVVWNRLSCKCCGRTLRTTKPFYISHYAKLFHVPSVSVCCTR